MKMGLVGSGIAKSRMPRLQKYLASLCGIDIDYILIDGAGKEGFDPVAEVQKRVREGFAGVNVTHPYKQRVWDIVHQPLVKAQAAIGSYNTLKFVDNKVFGANTDFTGFVRGYRYRLGDTRPGVTLLCGAGGVGRAIAFGLAELGAEEIKIFDLQQQQAETLRDAIIAVGGQASLVSKESFADAMQEAEGLVNCTALGMYSHAGSAFPAAGIGPQRWAFDAVYTPLETEFLKQCKQHNLACLSGFDLWIFQGIDAFKIYTSITVEADEKLLSTALSWLD